MTSGQTVQFTTTDGQHLTGDLAVPSGAPAGGVVVCHPHPQYGGNRFNPVVTAIFASLPAAGFVALRFDFRRDFGGGTSERLDVVAALGAIAEHCDAPTWLAGYSFGAAVALAVEDARVRGVAAVAPPLSMMTIGTPAAPTLVLSPVHDQFSPASSTRPIVDAWPGATFEPVESADHFLAGHSATVAERVTTWIGQQAAGTS